jgi:hypothetical protein
MMIHELHFVINQQLYHDLRELSLKLNKKLSTTIVFIFQHMGFLIEKNHFLANEKNSEYHFLPYPKEKRIHIHCYLPEHQYRKMKLIHQDLNTYSLAQIIREIIIIFLKGCAKHGINSFLNRLNKISQDWENKKRHIMREKKFLKNNCRIIIIYRHIV